MIKSYDVALPKSNTGRPGNFRVTEDIREFLDSGHDVAEIDIGSKDARYARRSYSQVASHMGVSSRMMVSSRDGRLFLIRKKALEN